MNELYLAALFRVMVFRYAAELGGEENAVNSFISACLKGPAFASVLGIQPVTIPYATTEPVEKGIFKIVASV